MLIANQRMPIVPLLVSMLFACVVWAQDYTEVNLREGYESVVKADPFLMSGGVSVVSSESLGEVLIGVGIAPVKSGPQTGRDLLNLRTVARSNAMKTISVWMGSKIETHSKSEKHKIVQLKSTPEGVIRLKRVKKLISTWTREHSEAALRRATLIGTWRSGDGKFFYAAVVVRS